jgi:phosphoserine phosphatase RsbU/P
VAAPDAARPAQTAVLVVYNPSGGSSRVRLEHLPFRIGRLGDNELVLRDSRASRNHARIVADAGRFVIEDMASRYGVFVNGERVERHTLANGDRIEFGLADSYRLEFALEDAGAVKPDAGSLAGSTLPRLRAMLELARALETSLSTDEVLSSVVEAALAVTGCERGFLLLARDGASDLDIRVARSRTGPLQPGELRVPTRLLLRALHQRKEFLSMGFDPATEGAERTVADLELRSVVCVPLVRVRTGLSGGETAALSAVHDTLGLLYMDSRFEPADLSGGSRELLTTLALEASTVLENARLLEQQWERQRTEQELRIARQIQQSLLPRALPATGWLRAAGSTTPSLQVGGDYFDLREINPGCWTAVIADVSGKGVGAALLASLLQGMFLGAPYTRLSIEEVMAGVNRFLNERTGGEQYATLFYCTVEGGGEVCWASAGHPPALLVRAHGIPVPLAANGMPLGMLEESTYVAERAVLEPGDKLVLYTDGLTEASNSNGDFFGSRRLRDLAAAAPPEAGATDMYHAIREALEQFTGCAPQNDDVTLLVIEYRPASQ